MEHLLERALGPLDITMIVVAAIVFVCLVSLIREPARRRFMAIFVAGAGAVYLNGGFGIWEFVYIAIATYVAYRGLESYRYIGLAWMMHTGWDLAHHLYGETIWLFAPTSSAGCALMDTLIALWFFAGAPSVYRLFARQGTSVTALSS